MSAAVRAAVREGRVHVMVEGRALCGGGPGARAERAWQGDIGPANCAGCRRILKAKAERLTKTNAETLNAEMLKMKKGILTEGNEG